MIDIEKLIKFLDGTKYSVEFAIDQLGLNDIGIEEDFDILYECLFQCEKCDIWHPISNYYRKGICMDCYRKDI